MKIYGWITAAFFGGALLLGCGGNGTSQTVGEGTKPGDASVTGVKANGTGKSPAESGDELEAVEPPLGPTATPAEVVSYFLDSLQAGDAPRVAGAFTKKARTELSREGLKIKDDGLPGSEYKIGPVEFVGKRKDGAHVETLWATPDEKEGQRNVTVTWVLRKQEAGWRIAGMAYEGEEVGSQEFMNFENPQEILDKQRENVETATKESPTRRPATRQK